MEFIYEKGKLIIVFHRKLNRSPKQDFMSPVKVV